MNDKKSLDITLNSLSDSSEKKDDDVDGTGKDEKSFAETGSRAAYFVFYLLGMGTLLPWNFFITADGYWKYKFRNTDPNATTNSTDLTPLQSHFNSYLSVASMVPNVIFLMLNTFLSHRIRQQYRLVVTLIVVIIMFIVTTVFVEIDTDDYQSEFFVIIMIIVVVMNSNAAVFQGGLFGVAGQLPSVYLNAVMSGQALGGIFASVASIVSIAVAASPTGSALVYFLLADITLVISLAAYLWVVTLPFYRRQTRMDALHHQDHPTSSSSNISTLRIFKKIWMEAFSVFSVFLVTLSLFPALAANIISTHTNKSTIWTAQYFVPVTCFLIFNSTDYMGRVACGFVRWPKGGSRLTPVLCVLRVVFVPLFIYCNARPRQLPVLFDDPYYIVFMVLFGLTNGYLSTLSLMFAPSRVNKEEQETASAMMAAFLGVGLCSGAALSNLVARIPNM